MEKRVVVMETLARDRRAQELSNGLVEGIRKELEDITGAPVTREGDQLLVNMPSNPKKAALMLERVAAQGVGHGPCRACGDRWVGEAGDVHCPRGHCSAPGTPGHEECAR